MLEPSRRIRPSSHLIGVVAAVGYIFLWASAFVPSRILARSAPPLAILSLRFLFAGALVLAGARALRLAIPRDADAWLQIFLLGVGGNAIYLGCNYEALRHMSAGMGSIIASTNPLVIAIVAPFALREPLTARKIAGLSLGFAGVLIAMHARTGTQEARIQDVLLSFAGVSSFVASNILYKRMRLRPHPVVLNGGQLFCAGLALVPATFLFEGVPRIDWTGPVVVSLAYLVVVLSVGASMLWFWILEHGEASRVSAYFFLTPVFGLLIGAALLGERLVWLDAIGLAVIAAGLSLVARS
ncbi:MAG: DMT family transporter [Myxococcales bacterium]